MRQAKALAELMKRGAGACRWAFLASVVPLAIAPALATDHEPRFCNGDCIDLVNQGVRPPPDGLYNQTRSGFSGVGVRSFRPGRYTTYADPVGRTIRLPRPPPMLTAELMPDPRPSLEESGSSGDVAEENRRPGERGASEPGDSTGEGPSGEGSRPEDRPATRFAPDLVDRGDGVLISEEGESPSEPDLPASADTLSPELERSPGLLQPAPVPGLGRLRPGEAAAVRAGNQFVVIGLFRSSGFVWDNPEDVRRFASLLLRTVTEGVPAEQLGSVVEAISSAVMAALLPPSPEAARASSEAVASGLAEGAVAVAVEGGVNPASLVERSSAGATRAAVERAVATASPVPPVVRDAARGAVAGSVRGTVLYVNPLEDSLEPREILRGAAAGAAEAAVSAAAAEGVDAGDAVEAASEGAVAAAIESAAGGEEEALNAAAAASSGATSGALRGSRSAGLDPGRGAMRALAGARVGAQTGATARGENPFDLIRAAGIASLEASSEEGGPADDPVSPEVSVAAENLEGVGEDSLDPADLEDLEAQEGEQVTVPVDDEEYFAPN